MESTEEDEIRADQIYDLNALKLLDYSFLRVATNLKSDRLVSVAAAYQRNLLRAFSIARFLPYTIGLASIRDRCFSMAKLKVLGELSFSSNPTDESKDEIVEVANSLLENHFLRCPDSQRQSMAWDFGVVVLGELVESAGNEGIRRALGTLLPTVITLTWTAFEVMAGDLWEAAVNTRPNRLSLLQGKRWRKNVPNASKNSVKDESESKKIDLDFIARNGFDLSSKMGTILREKFGFSKLDGIRDAYATAFDEKREAIEMAVTDASLDYLAAVRNVLVHRSGRADLEFCKKVSGHSELSQFECGRQVNLTAELVVKLVNAAAITGRILITGVDDWLELQK